MTDKETVYRNLDLAVKAYPNYKYFTGGGVSVCNELDGPNVKIILDNYNDDELIESYKMEIQYSKEPILEQLANVLHLLPFTISIQGENYYIKKGGVLNGGRFYTIGLSPDNFDLDRIIIYIHEILGKSKKDLKKLLKTKILALKPNYKEYIDYLFDSLLNETK